MDQPVFLDTNIFMYAVGHTHRYKKPCLQILEKVETGRLNAFINTEVLQELLYRYHHIGLTEKGVQICQDIMNFPITILPVMHEDIHFALGLMKDFQHKGISPRDVIHAATIKHHNIKHIFSADNDFDQFDFVKRTDPCEYMGI